MEKIKVQNISTLEAIKPSSPTPPHLRTYKLSLFDQIAPRVYLPIAFFYSGTGQDPRRRSDHLKDSLSKTLTHFYPFAGRLKDDGFTVDCNDEGATYVEAEVDADMSSLLNDPDLDVLEQLLPCNPLESSASQPIVAVRVNYFNCGGMAVCVCIHHVLADASAAASFVKAWAEVATRGDSNHKDTMNNVIHDCTSLFPPQDMSSFYKMIQENSAVAQPEQKVVTKRFVFEASKVSTLRNRIRVDDQINAYYPTRVEAVSVLIWAALKAAAKQKHEQVEIHAATTVINLRKRLNPPLPQRCIGNICQFVVAKSMMETKTSLSSMAKTIHDSIIGMDDEYIRNAYQNGRLLKFLKNVFDEIGNNPKVKSFSFSSWCSFPFYETDFGWGKPNWIGTTMRRNELAILVDTSDGKGIEAWITLSQDDMAKFEQDNGIRTYATFKPSM